MKVHLRKRKLRNKGSGKPRYTLYLDIYYSKRKRKREFLGLYLEPNDTKQTRLDKLRLAENYKAKRLLELANEELGLPSKEKMERDFINYFKDEMHKREGNSQTAWRNTFIHIKRFQPRGIALIQRFTNLVKMILSLYTYCYIFKPMKIK
jgi:hypothetical protein